MWETRETRETRPNPRNHTLISSFVFHNANKCSTCYNQKGRIQSVALNRQEVCYKLIHTRLIILCMQMCLYAYIYVYIYIIRHLPFHSWLLEHVNITLPDCIWIWLNSIKCDGVEVLIGCLTVNEGMNESSLIEIEFDDPLPPPFKGLVEWYLH